MSGAPVGESREALSSVFNALKDAAMIDKRVGTVALTVGSQP